MLDRPARVELPASSVSPPPSRLERFSTGAGGHAFWLMARCLMGGLFVQSGFAKLTGLDAFAASLAKNGVPMADIAAMIGAAVEFGGGLAIVVGLQTRYAALLMLAFTIAATLISHRFWEFADPAAGGPVRKEHRHHRRLSSPVRARGRTLQRGWLVAAA